LHPLSTRDRWLIIALLAAALLLLAGILVWLELRSQVALGPQRQVVTVNDKVGIHTRLTDEVEEWKIKRTLEMVREMGAPWAVEYFPWAYIEGEPDQWNWTHADQVVEHANQQGVRLVARLGYVPEWARPKETTPLYLDEEYFGAFGEFAAEFVTRYAGKVDHVVLWNEPNLALEWGYQKPSPEKYTEMLRVVYPMIKAANPDIVVLAGALAPTNAPEGSEWGMNDLDFLQRMYDAGAAPYFDMLAVHAYGWHADADDPADPQAVNFRRTELLREIMIENGDEATKAMITEGGWNDHPRWTRSVSPAQRIRNTLRAYEIGELEWPWMEAVCLWVFRFPWDSKTYQDYYTFVDTDFEAKAIYEEVQRYTAGEAPAAE
jgi:hypothetical protein